MGNMRISKSQPQKQKISDKEQQKQLKELLRQIHKKNEELKIQQEMNENLKLATQLNGAQNGRDYIKKNESEAVSSITSSKRNMERF